MVNSENISPLKLIFDHSYFYPMLNNGISFSLIGRPPSFDPAWFSQTMTLKALNVFCFIPTAGSKLR